MVLEQEGAQRFAGLRFTAKVTVELRERRPDGMLDFRMVSGDFRRFEGAWFICPDPLGGVRLRYEVLIQACRGMPIGLIEQRLKEDLSMNLRAVAAEAMKRSVRQHKRNRARHLLINDYQVVAVGKEMGRLPVKWIPPRGFEPLSLREREVS